MNTGEPVPDPQPPEKRDRNPERYDVLVDWPQRLAYEGPFYRHLFEAGGARRVLDTACGTGRHAAMFQSWGLQVEGADVSPAMIDFCRRRYPEPDAPRWVTRSFEQPCDSPGSFDAVVCVGNSLELAADMVTVRRAVAAMLGSLRPGGACVVQVLNLAAIPEGPTVWKKCKRVGYGGRERILMKGIHRIGARGYIDFVELTLDDHELTSRVESPTLLGLAREDLLPMLESGGATDLQTYGDYEGQAFDPSASRDLIVVCRRAN